MNAYDAIADAGGYSKTVSGQGSQKKRKRDRDKAIRAAYKVVDQRDGLVSWLTGKTLTTRKDAPMGRRVERHHMERRSQSKARQGDPFNIITCSMGIEAQMLDEHAVYPVNAAGEEVKDVREIDRFEWNRSVIKEGREPFALKPRP